MADNNTLEKRETTEDGSFNMPNGAFFNVSQLNETYFTNSRLTMFNHFGSNYEILNMGFQNDGMYRCFEDIQQNFENTSQTSISFQQLPCIDYFK